MWCKIRKDLLEFPEGRSTEVDAVVCGIQLHGHIVCWSVCMGSSSCCWCKLCPEGSRCRPCIPLKQYFPSVKKNQIFFVFSFLKSLTFVALHLRIATPSIRALTGRMVLLGDAVCTGTARVGNDARILTTLVDARSVACAVGVKCAFRFR